MNTNYKKQKEQVNQKTYEIRPKLPKKFTKTVYHKILLIQKVLDILQKSLEDNLKDITVYNHENVLGLNKTICEEVLRKLKSDSTNINKRYKILVHCIIGQRKGQGIRIGSRCIWDTNSDSSVWASYENECIYAFLVAYGVYFY